MRRAKPLTTALLATGILTASGALALYFYTRPGLRQLPKARRASLDGMTTIADAVAACRRSGLTGWELVAYAQNLAARKFTYSRRNPWDTPARAFERGLGYCQQQALALKEIYDRLGIHAEPVFALQCGFPSSIIHGIAEPGRISAHTWLQVTMDGEPRDVCPGCVANRPGITHFQVLSKVRPLSPWMRPFAHLGSVVENARRDRQALAQACEEFFYECNYLPQRRGGHGVFTCFFPWATKRSLACLRGEWPERLSSYL